MFLSELNSVSALVELLFFIVFALVSLFIFELWTDLLGVSVRIIWLGSASVTRLGRFFFGQIHLFC